MTLTLTTMLPRLLLATPLCLTPLHADILRVDVDATDPSPDGSTWAKAFPDLQDALAAAALTPGTDEIWVAEGIYTPGTLRTDKFAMRDGVGLYGGFVGNETSRAAANYLTNPTILSGDLLQDDDSGGNNSENAYHVLTASGVGSTAVLDGFTIQGGNANGASPSQARGGAIDILLGSPTLRFCKFLDNRATNGGAISNENKSSPLIFRCTFGSATGVQNEATTNGGAIINKDFSSPTLRSCFFNYNKAGNYGGAIYNLNNSSPSIEACQFILNEATYGGAILSEGSAPTITNSRFLGNSASLDGGAIHNFTGSAPSIEGCLFEFNNSVSTGGAITNLSNSSPTIRRCLLRGNESGYGGAINNNTGCSPLIQSCVLSGNKANFRGGALLNQNSSSPTLTNLTFHGNDAGQDGGAIYNFNNSSPILTNCIIDFNRAFGNTTTTSASIFNDGSAPTLSHCLVEFSGGSSSWNSALGTDNGGNIEGFPSFVGGITPASAPTVLGDLRLRAGSLAIGAGTAVANTAQDLTGNNRILGIGIDIGAYEGGVTDIDSWALSGSFEPDATTLSITLDARDTGSLPPLWANTIAVETTGDASYSAVQGSGSGPLYTLTLFGLSGEGRFTISFDPALATAKGILLDSNSTFTANLRSSTASPVHYVDADNPNPAPPYDNWTNAANNLQDALAWVESGEEIWVAEGTYYPDQGEGQTPDDRTATFTLKDGVELYGGFAGNETLRTGRNPATHPTILSGDLLQNDSAAPNSTDDNAYHVLYALGVTSTCVLDGFTITAGNADAYGGAIYSNSSSPSLTNCSFQGNSAINNGGAIFNFNSSPSLTNCSFQGNAANNHGGAIYNESSSSPSLTNCSFQGNSAFNHGGAIYNIGSSPPLTNCSFQGNFAVSGGAIRNSDNSSPTLINCSLQGNSASFGAAIYNSFSSPSIINCSFQGNSTALEGGAIRNFDNSSPSLINCILWNNALAGDTAVAGASVYNTANSTPTYSHCLIANSGGSGSWNTALGTDGGNNLDANPLFVLEVDPLTAPTTGGDLRLSFGSPALNAGNDLANTTLTDLAGNPRKIGIIDLGAYESEIIAITFAALHPGLDPNGDANGNGVSNFVDYAAGGDPTAPDDPSLRPTLIGNQLTFSYRSNANDINLQYEKSTTLLADSWADMILGIDYTVSNSSTNSGRTIETLTLLSPVLDEPTIFFREDFDADEM